jgi:hypothetical protein
VNGLPNVCCHPSARNQDRVHATQSRRIQLLLGHSNLATTSKYLRITTSQVCATASPLDALQVMTHAHSGGQRIPQRSSPP